MEFYENITGEEGNGKRPHKIHFPRKSSEPCLWFLLRSKSSMLWNSMKILLARKATENDLIKSTSLEKAQSPVSGFCYARNRVCNAAAAASDNVYTRSGVKSRKTAFSKKTVSFLFSLLSWSLLIFQECNIDPEDYHF